MLVHYDSKDDFKVSIAGIHVRGSRLRTLNLSLDLMGVLMKRRTAVQYLFRRVYDEQYSSCVGTCSV